MPEFPPTQKKPEPFETRVAIARQEDWTQYPLTTQETLRNAALGTLRAQAAQAGASELLDPTEFVRDGQRYLSLKGTVDRAHPNR